ncbi:hypothetical protein [Rouxiella sp. Mn2063]|uniref:hypothetical protein n=1 Tax=Rouxiella sp. Mn2063 TaxID=3395262 RepID=UPI003BCD594B
MKLWLSGLALLVISAGVQAENYRIVQSPSQKLDVWIDNIKDNTPKSWCGGDLPLRIVANGEKNVHLLNSFMPRLGSLLESQCRTLNVVHWTFTAPDGTTLNQGIAKKSGEWAPIVAAETVSTEVVSTATATTTTDTASAATTNATPSVVAPAAVRPETLSPAADHSPWLEFKLLSGCHLRTFWNDSASSPTLFIPDQGAGKCEKVGWLNGRSDVIQLNKGVEKKLTMTFVDGFPISGLSKNADIESLLITTVNNERMVLSDAHSDQSWMILPYVSSLNGWKADGTVAVEVSHELASDEVRLNARLDDVRKVWSALLEPGTKLNIVLVDALYPQLRNPAASAYRTVK